MLRQQKECLRTRKTGGNIQNAGALSVDWILNLSESVTQMKPVFISKVQLELDKSIFIENSCCSFYSKHILPNAINFRLKLFLILVSIQISKACEIDALGPVKVIFATTKQCFHHSNFHQWKFFRRFFIIFGYHSFRFINQITRKFFIDA